MRRLQRVSLFPRIYPATELDRLNIIAIDVSHIVAIPRSSTGRLTGWVPQINHDVTPDSLLLLHAAREVVEEEGFDDQLDDVRDRVDEIESLHRTRELTVRALSLFHALYLAKLQGSSSLIAFPFSSRT